MLRFFSYFCLELTYDTRSKQNFPSRFHKDIGKKTLSQDLFSLFLSKIPQCFLTRIRVISYFYGVVYLSQLGFWIFGAQLARD